MRGRSTHLLAEQIPGRRPYEVDIATRITVEIEPGVTAEQLAGWWRDFRRGAGWLTDRRAQSERLIRLAEFMSTWEGPVGEEARSVWNALVAARDWPPTWKYLGPCSNFRTDAASAPRRLLFAGYGH
jgi:hypothetical protein